MELSQGTWLAILGGIILFAVLRSRSQPAKKKQAVATVFLDDLKDSVQLRGPGPFRIVVYRQSGNVHSETVVETADGALKSSTSTFRRAKILAVRIARNETDSLEFWRTFHDHRGRAEGKKVAGVKIERLS